MYKIESDNLYLNLILHTPTFVFSLFTTNKSFGFLVVATMLQKCPQSNYQFGENVNELTNT